jgi:hypothetical protein
MELLGVEAVYPKPKLSQPGEGVKGGAKLDHWGREKVGHFLVVWGFGLWDLRGRLERRPAAPGGRRV